MLLKRSVITDPIAYAEKKYGGSWSIIQDVTIPGFSPISMDEFDHKNHCTLTAVTAVMQYYGSLRDEQGEPLLSGIPGLSRVIFARVRKWAGEHLLYFPRLGVQPWWIDTLVRGIWREFGYEGGAKNKFLFTRASLEKTLRREILQKRPGIISFTHNQYARHSVTYYGYLLIRGNREVKMMLRVNDHWSVEPRYVDVSTLGRIQETFYEVCMVYPPKCLEEDLSK